MNCNATSNWNFRLIFSSLLLLNKMEFGKFLDFIYFSLFTLSVNFPDQLVNEMSESILKS